MRDDGWISVASGEFRLDSRDGGLEVNTATVSNTWPRNRREDTTRTTDRRNAWGKGIGNSCFFFLFVKGSMNKFGSGKKQRLYA